MLSIVKAGYCFIEQFSTLLHAYPTTFAIKKVFLEYTVQYLPIYPYSQVCFPPDAMALSQARFPDADPFEAGEKELTRGEK